MLKTHSLLELVIQVVLMVVPLRSSYQNYCCVHSLVSLLVLLLQHQIFLLLLLRWFSQKKSIILIIFANLVVLLIIVLLFLLSEGWVSFFSFNYMKRYLLIDNHVYKCKYLICCQNIISTIIDFGWKLYNWWIAIVVCGMSRCRQSCRLCEFMLRQMFQQELKVIWSSLILIKESMSK